MTVPHSGRGWRLAPALIALEAEADRVAPKRRRTSDGSIGDRAHAARASNHNPDRGWVDAIDISHDPARGMDIHAHVRSWVARQDPRLDEVISNHRIWTHDRRKEGWRPYSGENGHTFHAHITVRDSHRHDTSPWFGSVLLPTKPNPHPHPQPAPQVETSTPPTGEHMRFFISDPSYGIRLVLTDGHCVVDYGVSKLEQLSGPVPTPHGGPMTPAEFAAFCARYPGGRFVRGLLPS